MDLNQKIKKVKNSLKKIQSLDQKLKGLNISIDKVLEKDFKVLTCVECSTKFPKETLTKYKNRLTRRSVFHCPVCSNTKLSKTVKNKETKLNEDIKKIREESKDQMSLIKTDIGVALSNISAVVRNEKGHMELEKWRVEDESICLVFRNNHYFYHSSYDHEADCDDLEPFEKKIGKYLSKYKKLEVSICESEKYWAEVIISLK